VECSALGAKSEASSSRGLDARADSADPILHPRGARFRTHRPEPGPRPFRGSRRSRSKLPSRRSAKSTRARWLFESAIAELAGSTGQARGRGEFRAFLEETRCADLPVLVIKSAGEFPYESSNLDLLVPEERMEEAARILTSHGFLHLRTYREPQKTLHKRFDRARPGAVFHLHHELSWVGAIFSTCVPSGKSEALADSGAWRLSPPGRADHRPRSLRRRGQRGSAPGARPIDSGAVDRLGSGAMREAGWSGVSTWGNGWWLRAADLGSERLSAARRRRFFGQSRDSSRCRSAPGGAGDSSPQDRRSRDETLLDGWDSPRLSLRDFIRPAPAAYRESLALSGVDGSRVLYGSAPILPRECDVP
jgi:hypothetical protein